MYLSVAGLDYLLCRR